jgi:hypothetical protein
MHWGAFCGIDRQQKSVHMNSRNNPKVWHCLETFPSLFQNMNDLKEVLKS